MTDVPNEPPNLWDKLKAASDKDKASRKAAERAARPALSVVPAAVDHHHGLHPYAAAAIAGELQRLSDLARPWHEGAGWDTTTYEVACNLIELANSSWSGYSLDQAEHDHRQAAPADSAWGGHEIAQKWRSALDTVGAGSRPEPAPRDLDVREVDADEFGVTVERDPLARFNLIDWATLKHTEDVAEEWLAYPLIAARRMTALYSAPKAGKSLLVLEVVAAIALGRPVLGQAAQDPVGVLYIDFENDPRGDIKPRLEDMGYDLDDLAGHLFYATFPSMARLDTEQGGMDLLYLSQHLGVALVVIDTVSRTVAGEENDNNTWLSFYKNTGAPLKSAGIACLRLDHSGKDVEKGMRGGSAKYGDVDAVWRLTAASESVLELRCTDHRMQMPVDAFTVVRHLDPLRHDVAGDPFAVAMDAKERELIKELDRLEIPAELGRDKVRKLLGEHGIKIQNGVLGRVIRARKTVTGDLSGTGRGHLSPPTSVAACPAPPFRGPDGGQVELSQTDDEIPPMFLVGCKACYRPTDRDVAHANGGICDTCHEKRNQS